MADFSEQIFTIDPNALKVMVPLLCSLLGFVVSWFYMVSEKRKAFLIEKHGEDEGLSKLIISSKWMGVFTMGIFPLTCYLAFFPESSLRSLGLGIDPSQLLDGMLWMTALLLFIVPLTIRHTKKPEAQRAYPQIRAKKWTKSTLRNYLTGWAFYMIAYEIMYRGVLLFPLVEVLGLWPAIGVNMVFSSATHIQKGPAETYGAIPLSLVFSLITIYTGSIWYVTVPHAAMAVVNSYYAFKHHPEMALVDND